MQSGQKPAWHKQKPSQIGKQRAGSLTVELDIQDCCVPLTPSVSMSRQVAPHHRAEEPDCRPPLFWPPLDLTVMQTWPSPSKLTFMTAGASAPQGGVRVIFQSGSTESQNSQ